MKKYVSLFVLTFILTTQVAFSQSFQEGDKIISVGYGTGNLAKTLFNTYKDNSGYNFKSFGPIFGKFEYGISDKIGLGVNVAHLGIDIAYKEDNYNYRVKWNNTSFLARLNLHFSKNEKLDAFWGVGLGLRVGGKINYETNDPNGTSEKIDNIVIPVGFETTIGARYFFTENIGIYAEAGLAKAVIQGGLTFRIR